MAAAKTGPGASPGAAAMPCAGPYATGATVPGAGAGRARAAMP